MSQKSAASKEVKHLGRFHDEWQGSIKVEPAGALRVEHASGVLTSEGDNKIKLTLPSKDEIIPGSMRAIFALYQSPEATLGSALESLLQQPHSGFEQISSIVYVTTMAMHYLNWQHDVPKTV